ncbi:MAG: glycosyltransferase family 4 protein [Parcubacteria group bacterium]|jgi:glycosyltransferase involved in cell wall biosynthesis
MDKTTGKILFVSHDASRTGAPFVLLHLLKWLKENTEVEFEVLLKNGGELESEFEALAPTYIWYKPGNPKNLFEKILLYYNLSSLSPNSHKDKLSRLFLQKKFNVIFTNSVASCDAINELKQRLDIPIICYLHELEISIRQFCGLDVFKEAQKNIDLYIGSSKMVVDNLKINHGLSDKKIDLVYDYIPAKEYHEARNEYDTQELRMKIGVPDGSFVVGSCGTIDWRKGVDLIPQISRLVRQKSDLPIYFVWIGGVQSGVDFEKFLQDVDKLNLKDKVIFIDYALDYFAAIDVFLLPSREDPFPLVCLQAAAFEKPVICFELSGGIPDFVEKDCGFVVPYLDIEAAAEKIIELAQNRELCSRLGKNAAQKAMKRHDVSIAGRQIMDIIKKVLAKSRVV